MAEEVVWTDVQPQEANLSQSKPNSVETEVCSDSVQKERVDLESEMEMVVSGDELAKDIIHISQGNFAVCKSYV